MKLKSESPSSTAHPSSSPSTHLGWCGYFSVMLEQKTGNAGSIVVGANVEGSQTAGARLVAIAAPAQESLDNVGVVLLAG